MSRQITVRITTPIIGIDNIQDQTLKEAINNSKIELIKMWLPHTETKLESKIYQSTNEYTVVFSGIKHKFDIKSIKKHANDFKIGSVIYNFKSNELFHKYLIFQPRRPLFDKDQKRFKNEISKTVKNMKVFYYDHCPITNGLENNYINEIATNLICPFCCPFSMIIKVLDIEMNEDNSLKKLSIAFSNLNQYVDIIKLCNYPYGQYASVSPEHNGVVYDILFDNTIIAKRKFDQLE